VKMINLQRTFIKKTINYEAVIIFLLILAAFFYFSYGYKYYNVRTYHYDEGSIANGAALILNGGLLYRDCWTSEFPGQYYLMAAVFKTFGANLHTMRLSAMLILALLACLVYIAVKKFTRKGIALFAFFLTIAWLRSYMIYGRAPQTATLFSILSCLFIIRFIYSNRNMALIIAGIFIGLAAFFRQDFGLYTFIAVFAVIFLHQLEQHEYKDWMKCFKSISVKTSFLLLGIITVILPLVIYFMKIGNFREFIQDAVFFPLRILTNQRLYPFPALAFRNFVFYLPLFVFILAIIKIIINRYKARKNDNKRDLSLALFVLMGVCYFEYFRFHCCLSHLLYAMIFAIIVFAILLEDSLKSRWFGRFPAGSRIVNILIFLISIAAVIYSIRPAIRQSRISLQDENVIDITRASGFYDDSQMAKSQVSAIKYIQEKTGPGEMIFVGNTKHDRVVVGDSMFYFLAERNSATKYPRLDFGTTRRERQQEIIEDLKRNNTEYVVLCSIFTDEIYRYGNIPGGGADDLDAFIEENYRPEKTFGPYIILKHRI